MALQPLYNYDWKQVTAIVSVLKSTSYYFQCFRSETVYTRDKYTDPANTTVLRHYISRS